MASIPASNSISAERTAFSVIVAVSVCHMLNDIMQSLLTSLYPLLKANYALDFMQIGLLTFTFQVTASLLQPAVGVVTDRWPMPFSLPAGMLSTCAGLLLLANAHSFPLLLVAASLIGLGSAIFHPESSRIARLASGNAGDVKPVGSGVSEMRIPYGPGYRVYILQRGAILVVLLCGGEKASQVEDIASATDMARQWKGLM